VLLAGRARGARVRADALMMLTKMAWQLANSVVERAAYPDIYALLAETAAADERSLYEQGEA
jgi:hypothetical protein